MTSKISVPAGQIAGFDEVPGPFPGIQSFKPNAAMQQKILEDTQKAFPGLYLDANGVMQLPKKGV
jgi:hypothetical protein